MMMMKFSLKFHEEDYTLNESVDRITIHNIK